MSLLALLTLNRHCSLPRNIHRRTRLHRRWHSRYPHGPLPLGPLGRLGPHHRRHGPLVASHSNHLHPRLDLHNACLRPRPRPPLPRHGLLNPSRRRPTLYRLRRRLLLLLPRLRPSGGHRRRRHDIPEPSPAEDPAVSAYCVHGSRV